MRKVLELEGFESWLAYGVFHKLMLGMKMLPSYMGESYEEFFSKVDKMEPEDKIKVVSEAALFAEIRQEEFESIAFFCADKNGVRYRPENIKRLKIPDFFEIIVSVCMELAKVKINFVSDTEKKNLKISQ